MTTTQQGCIKKQADILNHVLDVVDRMPFVVRFE